MLPALSSISTRQGCDRCRRSPPRSRRFDRLARVRGCAASCPPGGSGCYRDFRNVLEQASKRRLATVAAGMRPAIAGCRPAQTRHDGRSASSCRHARCRCRDRQGQAQRFPITSPPAGDLPRSLIYRLTSTIMVRMMALGMSPATRGAAGSVRPKARRHPRRRARPPPRSGSSWANLTRYKPREFLDAARQVNEPISVIYGRRHAGRNPSRDAELAALPMSAPAAAAGKLAIMRSLPRGCGRAGGVSWRRLDRAEEEAIVSTT